MGGEELRELGSRARRSGIFLDFDGTLSEIAPTPQAAIPAPGTSETLAHLAERFALVAVVSGRRFSDVEDKLGRPRGVRIFGLYGMDRGAGTAADGASRAVEEILPRVMEVAGEIPGALVEPKGSNLAVHYRLAGDPVAARATLLEALEPLARSAGLRLVEGKRVLELVPASASTKGDLVAREGAGLEGVLYAGDDLADREAFVALDRLAAGGVHAVKVAVRSAETPAELLQEADLVAEGPAGLVELLRLLAG